MYFLSDRLIEHALQHFDAIDINTLPHSNFFETFGPGNLLSATDRPFERFSDYEELLNLLQKRNQQKYEKIHKGTPFFFLSWLAFDLRNYEKALYYLDAAISEDVKNAGEKWINLPGARILKLSTDNRHVAKRAISEVRNTLSFQLDRFNKISGLKGITVKTFVNKFVIPLIKTPSTRTIISALYIFLLEVPERLSELHLKSTHGSSLGPIISHLFSGGLIFESLLKYIYPLKDNGDPIKTLGEVFQTTPFRGDFEPGIQTSSVSLEDILRAVNNNSLKTAFSTTSKLRNTTGHNLVWDNIFQSPSNYEVLVNQIINALLFLIKKKFIR